MCCNFAGNHSGPALVYVAGPSNSGKTTLIERLIPRLRAQGLRVGTIKHAHHGFEMDVPGKDSWRHARAGAEAVAVVSPARAAWLLDTGTSLAVEELAAPLRGRVDLVLVEGFKQETSHPRIILQPAYGRRVAVEDRACVVGVSPGELGPEELESLVRFCLTARKEEQPCQPQ